MVGLTYWYQANRFSPKLKLIEQSGNEKSRPWGGKSLIVAQY
jgi:hypothetical protein